MSERVTIESVEECNKLVVKTADDILLLLSKTFEGVDKKQAWLLTARTVNLIFHRFYHPMWECTENAVESVQYKNEVIP